MNTKKFSEAMGEIDNKYVDEVLFFKKSKKGNIVKFGVVAACIIVLCIYADIILHSINKTNDRTQGEVIIDKQNIYLVVNKMEQTPMMNDMDVEIKNYNKQNDSDWEQMNNMFKDFTGLTYEEFEVQLPEKFHDNINVYSYLTREYQDGEFGEYKIHDFILEDKINDERQLTIAICNFSVPLRDCVIDDSNSKKSNVNETEVTIFGDNDMYIIQFVYEGTYYDIETRDMNEEELEELLLSIIK